MNISSKTWSIFGVIQTDSTGEALWKLAHLLVATFIFLQILFPFYVYVNRVNRERDKNTLVFPIIDHFYGMMKKTHAIYYFIYVTVFFIFVNESKIEKELFFYTILIVALYSFLLVLVIFTQVFQFFLTIMAVQKFLLYFYPSSQRYIILSGKNMKYFIRYTYILFIFKEIISSVLYIVNLLKSNRGEENSLRRVKLFSLMFFVSMDLTFFASALLYIPILISVRKMSNLRSVQESKPQIYIFWQTMTALIKKLIHTFLFLYILFDDITDMITYIRAWDAFSVPVIIQISYLTCNRRNVITLFASFKGMKLIKELFKPEVISTVCPDPKRHLI